MRRISRLACAGCGVEQPPDDPTPFRCAAAAPGDDIDHVIAHRLDLAALTAEHVALGGGAAKDFWAAVFAQDEPDPFLRYREFLHSWHAALAGGLTEDDWCDIVEGLGRAVHGVGGRNFRETPFEPAPALGRALGLPGPDDLWVKDETGNVSGSHKGRHLMGILIWLEVMRRLGRLPDGERPLAIASCGNAALAAAVLAKAGERRLDVYIPADANPNVVRSLRALGARINVCPRDPEQRGDPAYLAFRKAILAGAIPFTCQGSDNGLTIDGGKTLAYEIVSALRRRDAPPLDRLFIQVGGGALASAVIQGLGEAHGLGLISRMPRIHAVQTEGGHPLIRAWQSFIDRFGTFRSAAGGPPLDAGEIDRLNRDLAWAAHHRSSFMRPWETTPASVAHGILDDETYDWLAVVKGMIETGGCPVLVDEALLIEATAMAREKTGIPVDPTGAAGLAGFLAFHRRGLSEPGERIGVLFTGAAR